MTTFRSDLQLALRLLAKKPGFALIAVLTLALGIAVNATMFSMVSAFLLLRPSGREPERIVVISSVNPNPSYSPDTFPVSAPNYLAWRAANDVFADMAAADEYRAANLTGLVESPSGAEGAQGQVGAMTQAEALPSAAVSPNYFRVLGVSTQIGRTFADGEDQPGRDHAMILSHDLWVRRFGSDASVVGRSVRLNRENYTVIGVMPTNFHLMGYTPQLWTPLVLSASDQTEAARKDRSLRLFARLKTGVAVEQARAEILALARRTEENFPETEKGWGASVRTLPDFLVHDFGIRGGLAVLMTTVGFVLMIACANVAGLLLARAAGRRKELAIRISLGAGRWRIVRQLLTEGLVIALVGGLTGLLFSVWGIKFLRVNMSFNEAVAAVPITLDRNVLFFAVGISLASAVLCSLAPALKASRTDVNTGLKDESRAASAGRSHTRLRTTLVTTEIALALFLLIGTGLLVRGIFIIEHQNLGFQPGQILTANLALDDARYKNASERLLFAQDIVRRMQHLPGAETVAITSDLPATGPGSVPFRIKGQPEQANAQQLTTLDAVVSTDYFRAAGIPLLRGRTFTEMDNATAPRVVLVSQEFVNRHLKGQDPLGKQIRLDVKEAGPEWSEIVGIVGNVKFYSESAQEEPQVYETFSQRPVNFFSLTIRTNVDPNSLASSLRSTVALIDADLPLARVMSMPAVIDRQRGGDSLFTWILGAFAFLALVLAAIGIYGLIAFSVGQRTHEIGIRMALGAGKSEVLRMVLREGLRMGIVGVVVGLLLALPLPKVFEAMFYGFTIGEPHLYFLMPVVLLAVAMLATYVPARRAARVDPMRALRQE